MIATDLAGKAALVTGGASGIGLALATLYARAGAAVAINHLADDPRGPEAVARLAAEGHRVIAAPGDVGDADDAPRMVRDAVDALGRLDFLANNAGTPATRQPIDFPDLDAIDEAFWARILAVNLMGPFRCAKAAAPALKATRGAIVNTASVAGTSAIGSSIPYAASKGALVNLTRTLAKALAPEVRVNAVAPGFVLSPWTREWGEERKQASIEKALLRRACTPEDIAEAMFFLTAAAGMVTAQTLVVDGGLTA